MPAIARNHPFPPLNPKNHDNVQETLKTTVMSKKTTLGLAKQKERRRRIAERKAAEYAVMRLSDRKPIYRFPFGYPFTFIPPING